MLVASCEAFESRQMMKKAGMVEAAYAFWEERLSKQDGYLIKSFRLPNVRNQLSVIQ